MYARAISWNYCIKEEYKMQVRHVDWTGIETTMGFDNGQRGVLKTLGSTTVSFRSLGTLERFTSQGLEICNFRFQLTDWVTRTISGLPLRPRFDVFDGAYDGFDELFQTDPDIQSRNRWLAGLPIPVYSCWNGMVALTARPFLPEALGGQSLGFRSANRETQECAASECSLLAKDMWRAGEKKWVLVPKVAVTYTEDDYKSEWIQERVRRGQLETNLSAVDQPSLEAGSLDPSDRLGELIDWTQVQPPEQVACYPWRNGVPFQPTVEYMVRDIHCLGVLSADTDAQSLWTHSGTRIVD